MKREYIKQKLKESFGRTLKDELMEKGLVPQQEEPKQSYVDEHKEKPKKQKRVNNRIRRRM